MLKWWHTIKEKIKTRLEKTVLPGFEGENLYDVGRFFLKGLNDGLEMRAAAVTFRFLLALFPLIVTFFSLIPFVPIENFQQDILTYIHLFLPDQVYTFFEPALNDLIVHKRTVLISIGFIVTIYFASSGFGALLEAFSISYQNAAKRKLIRHALLSISIIFILLILIALLTVVSGFGSLAIKYLVQTGWIDNNFAFYALTALQYIIIVFLYYCTISILYNFGHTAREKWSYFSVGTTSATVLIIFLQEFYSIYLSKFASFDKLYGPLGAILGFLLFFYYLFFFLIAGFELNASIDKSSRYRKRKLKSNSL